MIDALALMTVDDEFHPLPMEGDAQVVGSAVMRWVDSGLTARIVRGRKMRKRAGVFDEFASALQFPLYFGENGDAFDECIADLGTLPAGAGYVVLITEPDQVLADERAGCLEWFASSLKSAAHGWARPVELGEWWDRPAVPFHVVLAGSGDDLEVAIRRWSDAGATPAPLDQP
ncbi:barstar family protein [Propioniciclava soli]|uniref:barstar family protein n=1 Tax=Propioniciclava soli TaxID=2775081 RepID=UPI001E40B4B2|nr:barstar family protein [Propioniciclava soli]